jgi:hypothetical protein
MEKKEKEYLILKDLITSQMPTSVLSKANSICVTQISCPGKLYTSAFTVDRFSHIEDLLTVKNFTTDPQLIIFS